MIRVETDCRGDQLEPAVEVDIRAFEHWFKGLGNDPLVRSEMAILKTYLFWKCSGSRTDPEKGAKKNAQVVGP